jgi:hypothetical protein
MIQVQCENCNKTFERAPSQVNYQKKKGRRFFCSLSCSTTFNNIHKPKNSQNRYKVNQHSNNKKDEYTGFRSFITRIKQRAKSNSRFKDYNLTLVDLKNQWDLQKGLCPYTGLSLELPNHKSNFSNRLAKASLDRIDSSLGYIKDNIQFVSCYVNLMKSNLTESELRLLISCIRNKKE